MRSLSAAFLVLVLTTPFAAVAQPLPLADLALRAPGLVPAAPREGDGVTFNVTVLNQGTAAATTTVAFAVDGQTIFTSAPLLMLPGMALNVSNTLPWNATAGPHAFRAVVDPAGQVPEQNEANNALDMPFGVAALPNLRIVSLALDPADPEPGEAVAVVAIVENAGGGAAGPFHVRLGVDATLVTDASLPGLEAGKTAQVEGAWTATAGAHVASALADSQNQVAESDEGDNSRTFSFTVAPPTPQPDLVVADLRWSPASPTHGQDVRIEALVRNVGNATAPQTTTAFAIDGASIGTAATPTLAPGAESWVAAPLWRSQAGEHALRATADAGNVAAELDEANNARTESLVVAPAPGQPDLFVERITSSPASPQEGQTVVFTARLRNGGATAAGPFHVRFRVEGDAPGSVSVPGGLAGGAFADVQSPAWLAERGTHTLFVRADSGENVIESNEANNDATHAVSVTAALPDLVVDALRAEPAEPRPGDRVTFEAVVRNAGNAPAGAFHAVFRVDGRDVGDVIVQGLAQGAARTVRSEPWVAQQGARLARAVADARDEVGESREDNNEATLPLPTLTQLPNLVVEELRLQESDAGDGEAVHLLAVVANHGSRASEVSDVAFRVDGASIGAAALPGVAPGARATVASPAFTAREGSHAARATADASGRVAELSEEDNDREAAFAIGAPLERTSPEGAAAIAVSAPRITPAQPRAGESVAIRVEVRNDGTASASGLEARLRVDGKPVATRALPRLPPTGVAPVTFDWTAAEGEHALEVEVLQGGVPVAAAPLQVLTVAPSEPPAPAWLLPLAILAALAVLALAWASPPSPAVPR